MKKTFFLLLLISFSVLIDKSTAQVFQKQYPVLKQSVYKNNVIIADTTKPVTQRKKFSIGGIFISAGTGLSVPLQNFYTNSNPAFGLLGKLEYSTYSIFPFVIGGEVTYFSYNGSDDFKTQNVLSTFKTRVLSYGLSIEYTLSKLLNSSYTIPYITLDVKSNNIKREYDADETLEGLPRTESKISAAAGVGFTLFVLDFYVKYNYMKDMPSFGVFTKIKFPVIRF